MKELACFENIEATSPFRGQQGRLHAGGAYKEHHEGEILLPGQEGLISDFVS